MSDIVKRLRETAATAGYGPDRETAKAAAAEIDRLRAENASLSTWQCEFTDGKTGLVYGQGGTTFCIMAKRMEQNLGQIGQLSEGLDLLLEATSKQAAEIKRLRAALRDIEENSFSIYARDIARAALAAPSGALEERT